jgi:PiT family inorganic phosphate transporter
MEPMSWIVLALTALLAFANGANDNSKGVATLVGFGAATPRRALAWAAATTALGALGGALAGGALVAAFRADGLVGTADLAPGFFAAVLLGAVAWVLLATVSGLPVSTTHAILGGLLGAGWVEAGAAELGWGALVGRFALPLLLSPLLAFVLVGWVGRGIGRLLPRVEGRCLCVASDLAPLAAGSTALARSALTVVRGEVAACAVHSPALVASGRGAANAVHWGACGVVGFARGWNDTPKIVALALVALPASAGWGGAFAFVAVAMAAGGLLAGRRVLSTLATRITPLPLGESVAASGVASLLVALASWHGLPVSTTHVTTGGIVGAGVARAAGDVCWPVVREVALSWLVTLPAAAAIAASARLLLRS